VFATKVLEKPRMGDCITATASMYILKLIKESKNLSVDVTLYRNIVDNICYIVHT
jgi:hypothetical protein